MSHLPFHCERECHHVEIGNTTDFIVLTGGPGAGKTAVLEYVRKLLCRHVAILPEAAGILFQGGFWRLESDSARKAAQRAIYHVQNEMQELAKNEHQWRFVLCDRGTIDGLAYWPNSMPSFFASLHTTPEEEFKKYKAVIHLRSPDSNQGYNNQNPIRVETAQLAQEIDERIHEVWHDHPRYYEVSSTISFKEKIDQATAQILKLLPEDYAVCGKEAL